MDEKVSGAGVLLFLLGAAGLVGTNESGVGSYGLAIALMVAGGVALLIKYMNGDVKNEKNSKHYADASYPAYLQRMRKSS